MKYIFALIAIAGSTMISSLIAATHQDELILVAGATGGTGQFFVCLQQ